MLDIDEDLKPRKRLRLDLTLEDDTYLTAFNNSSERNSTGGAYTDGAYTDRTPIAPAATSNIARNGNVFLQTWSYGTTHAMASETCITHSTTTVQSTVTKYVRPTLTPDVSKIDAFATSGYNLVSSPRAEICFGAVGSSFLIHQ